MAGTGKSYHPNDCDSPKPALLGPSGPPIDWHKKECLQMALQACGPRADANRVTEMAQKFYEFMQVSDAKA